MYRFSTASFKRLNNSAVHPDIKKLMIEAIKTSPVDFSVIETARTVEQQKINIKKGVSKTLKSRHIPSSNKSGLCEAVDVAPYPINWKNISRFVELSKHIKNTAKNMGIKIQWGGDWKTFKDYPHYELAHK